jgi:putative transposase
VVPGQAGSFGHRRGPDPPLRRRRADTSLRFTEHLALEGIAPSVGSVGDAYDNALAETVIGLYKIECTATTVCHDGPYKTLTDVEYATAG